MRNDDGKMQNGDAELRILSSPFRRVALGIMGSPFRRDAITTAAVPTGTSFGYRNFVFCYSCTARIAINGLG